jgi:acetyl-CoA C-acetyltransferase
MEREAWIIDAVRSPRGKGKKTGALHEIAPAQSVSSRIQGLAGEIQALSEQVRPTPPGDGAPDAAEKQPPPAAGSE